MILRKEENAEANNCYQARGVTIAERVPSGCQCCPCFSSGKDHLDAFNQEIIWNLRDHILTFSDPHDFLQLKLGLCKLPKPPFMSMHVAVVELLSCVQIVMTPWTETRQAFLSFTVSQRLLKLMSTDSLMPSNHLILCCSLFFLPSVFHSIRVFSSESALHIRWPKCWSYNFNTSPFNKYSELISFSIDWFDLAVQGTLKSLLQHHNSKVLTLLYGPALTSIPSYWKHHSFDCMDLCQQSDVSIF